MTKLPFSPHAILVFADGASSGNPGPGGWGVIIVTPEGQIIEMGGGSPGTTNNRMELTAVIRALDQIKKIDVQTPIEIFTDSVYVIRGITQWIWGWRKNGWRTAEGQEVSNVDLWKQLSAATAGRKINWKFVRGHAGIAGNERVDEIAVAFTKGQRPDLYLGPLTRYSIPIHDLPDSFELPEMRAKDSGPKATPFCYLSLVNGKVERHATWKECEARVKGRSGAKFKKAMTEAEATKILKDWGI